MGMWFNKNYIYSILVVDKSITANDVRSGCTVVVY